MDPSEFEGTLERQEDALNAGALELLLNAPTEPSFVNIDLTKEVNDICLSIYSLKDSVSHLANEASLNSLCLVMDEQALKIAEMKESYVARRKILTAKVKKFYADISEEDSTSVNYCKELIDTFKVEFDSLAALSRYAETSFLSVHKSIREVPDPVSVLNETLMVCQRSHEALKKAQDQLNIANNALNASHHGVTGSSHGHVATFSTASTAKLQNELDALHSRIEIEKEELKESYLTELVNVRSKYEVDMRNREQELQSIFEKRQLDQQKLSDSIVAKLEVEISSLLRSVNEHKQSSLENEERRKVLDAEMVKRRELEDKLRTTFNNLSTSEALNAQLKTQIEALTSVTVTNEEKFTQERKLLTDKIEILSQDLLDTKNKLMSVSTELASRPPVDFTALMDKIGMIDDVSYSDSRNQSSLAAWLDIETYIVESIRKSNSEATSSRVREQESAKQLTVLENKCSGLWKQLEEQSALTASLERDLMNAHSMVNTKSNSKAAAKKAVTTEESAEDKELSGLVNAEGESTSSTDKVMLAVQSQRDRFMKQCREKDAELNSIKLALSKVQQEQEQQRKENLELYRRLRVLRVSGGQPHKRSQGNKMRSRRGVDHNDEGDEEGGGYDNDELGDTLDDKYMNLYEAEISPFKMEELDKESIMTKLNVFERMLVYMNKNVIQDRWSRHAFIVYLLLVHAFALMYTFSVLNPQLIEEVDQHLKNKWSAETFAMTEHPDA